MAPPGIPPPQGFGEELVRAAGGVTGFASVAVPVAVVSGGLGAGPLLANAIGAGVAGAAAPGTPLEKAVSGATMAAFAPALEAFSGRVTAGVAKSLARKAPEVMRGLMAEFNQGVEKAVESGVSQAEAEAAARAVLQQRLQAASTRAIAAARLATRATSAVGGAATFGVAQPAAAAALLRAAGEKGRAPTREEMLQSGLSLLALNVILGGRGMLRDFRAAVAAPEATRAAPPPFRPTPEETKAAQENTKRPETVPEHLRGASDDASKQLGAALAEIQSRGPVVFRGAGLDIRDATVIPGLARVFPGDPRAVRVTVLDNATGRLHSVGLEGMTALREAMTRQLPPEFQKPKEAEPELPRPSFTPKRGPEIPRTQPKFAPFGETAKAAKERRASAPAAIAALERQIAEHPGDARVKRWKRRLEKLREVVRTQPPPEEKKAAAPAGKPAVSPPKARPAEPNRAKPAAAAKPKGAAEQPKAGGPVTGKPEEAAAPTRPPLAPGEARPAVGGGKKPEKQATNAKGIPVWTVAIETKKGAAEIHNVVGRTEEQATKAGQRLAAKVGGILRGEPQAQEERRVPEAERRVTRAERPPAERRVLPARRQSDRAELVALVEHAANVGRRLKTLGPSEVMDFYRQRKPGVALPSKNPEEVRAFLTRELRAQENAARELLKRSGPVLAVRDKSGKVHSDPLASTHADVVDRAGISPDDVTSTGYIEPKTQKYLTADEGHPEWVKASAEGEGEPGVMEAIPVQEIGREEIVPEEWKTGGPLALPRPSPDQVAQDLKAVRMLGRIRLQGMWSRYFSEAPPTVREGGLDVPAARARLLARLKELKAGPSETTAKVRPKKAAGPKAAAIPVVNQGEATKVEAESRELDAQYVEVPIEAVKTSHNPLTFNQNPEYPFEQQRPYHSSKEEQAKVIREAKRWNPKRYFSDNVTPENGPTMVTPEGYALGGNGRMMMLLRAINDGDVKPDQLQAWVRQAGKKFGIENAGAKPGTIIVRMVKGEMGLGEMERATKTLNEASGMAIDPISGAVARAKAISQDTVDWISDRLHEAGPESTVRDDVLGDRATFGELMKRLVDDGVFTAKERPALVDQNTGKPTAVGQEAVEATLLATVLKRPSMIRSLLPQQRRMVFSALSEMAKLGSYDPEWRHLRTDLADAMELRRRATVEKLQPIRIKSGQGPGTMMSPLDQLLQPAIVEDKFIDRMRGNSVAQALYGWLEQNEGKPTKLREALKVYNQRAAASLLEQRGQEGLFGEAEVPKADPRAALNEAFGLDLTPAQFASRSPLETHEARASGAPRGAARAGPRPSAGKGIPIARNAPAIPTGAEARTLPERPVPPPAPGVTKGVLATGVEPLRETMHELVAITNPVRYAVGPNLDAFQRFKGTIKRAMWRTERAQAALHRFWENRSKGQVYDFVIRLQTGAQPDPRMAEIEAGYRERADNMFSAIARWKQIPYWENWFPQMWKNPDQAKVFFAARRPMEGTKSFLRKRFFQDWEAGLKAGLEPMSWNPEEMMQAAEHNARKYVMVQEMKEFYLALGSFVKVRPGGKIPEGFRELDQNWARLYLNPEIEIKEAYDRMIMDGLNAVADKLGISRERRVRIGGKRLGYSQSRPGQVGRVVTRFATPESVLAHEIGHQIDSKYGLQSKFLRQLKAKGKGSGAINKENVLIRKELRALADLRIGPEGAGPGHRAYVRAAEEKMAVMLEAFIHAPEAFQKTAPTVYSKFVKFLSSRPELAPLLSIKPSLLVEEATGKVSAGGVVLGSRIYAEENLARILDNHMSRDFITQTRFGRAIMDSRNTLNAINLGASAFHATSVTLLSIMSRAGVGISEAAHGRVLTGLGKFVSAPAAPIIYIRDGWRFYKDAPELAALEEKLFTGGAALERRQYYKNQMFDRFVRNARQTFASGATLYERLGHATKAMAQLPFFAVESSMRGLTNYVIPQMKVGAFRDLFSSQMRLESKKIAAGKTTEENIARLAWRDIEDRMGLLNYDNEFWHNTLKTSIMVLIRAPGWSLGTLRSLGGAAFADLPRFATAPLRGKAPEWTSRMSFALSMVFTTMAAGGIYHYLHTGRKPKTLEDYLHPQNGLTDERGRPMRVNFPTYMRDVEGWSHDPIKSLFGRVQHGRGESTLGHGGKIAPDVILAIDLLENQSYRGPIRNVNDPWYEQAGQVIRYIFGREQPFSISQARRIRREGGTREQVAEQFLGITPYFPPRKPRGRFRYREVQQ
jgi:hypothetical protein